MRALPLLTDWRQWPAGMPYSSVGTPEKVTVVPVKPLGGVMLASRPIAS